MSWIRDSTLSWLQRLSLRALQGGPIPRHVAFIMDGNRRFAVKANMKKTEGHSKGFDKLSEVLQWCLDIGVQEVTVYAFSIENFKRSKEEVETVLNLAREKFKRLLEEKDKLKENGICVRIIGNMDHIPEDIRRTIAEAVLETRHLDRAILNVAFAYTSRDEITNSIETIMDGVDRGELEEKDIDDDLITQCLYTGDRPDPDLLVRTSGETRLSDFLLWQTTNSVIYFTDVLWPEFKFWHLWAAIFKYQRTIYENQTYANHLSKATCKSKEHSRNERVERFLENKEARDVKVLEELWKPPTDISHSTD